VAKEKAGIVAATEHRQANQRQRDGDRSDQPSGNVWDAESPASSKTTGPWAAERSRERGLSPPDDTSSGHAHRDEPFAPNAVRQITTCDPLPLVESDNDPGKTRHPADRFFANDSSIDASFEYAVVLEGFSRIARKMTSSGARVTVKPALSRYSSDGYSPMNVGDRIAQCSVLPAREHRRVNN
jgi:hypothetical protein